MPQTQGAGTVYTGGPGTKMRGPLIISPGFQGSVGGVTPPNVQVFDASGNLWAPDGQSYESAVSVAITAAQLLALNTTPVTLVPAAGPKTIIVPDLVLFNFVYATQYTVNASSAYAVGLNGTTGMQFTASGNFSTQMKAMLHDTANAALLLNPDPSGIVQGASSNSINEPLQFTQANSGDDVTVGTSTMLVRVLYRVFLNLS